MNFQDKGQDRSWHDNWKHCNEILGIPWARQYFAIASEQMCWWSSDWEGKGILFTSTFRRLSIKSISWSGMPFHICALCKQSGITSTCNSILLSQSFQENANVPCYRDRDPLWFYLVPLFSHWTLTWNIFCCVKRIFLCHLSAEDWLRGLENSVLTIEFLSFI